jgi:hypothetical protein
MERRALVLALLVLTLPFAGCLGGDDAPTAERAGPAADAVTPSPGADDAPPSADAPVWSVGDAWSVVPQGDGETEPSTLVVTAADREGYTLSTTSGSTAGYDALYDVSYLGRIRASDLAGSQQGQPVQFFSFPLTDGKTWQAQWDGKTITLTATWKPAMPTSAGIHAGFAIEGLDGEAPYVKYDYVPMLRWWSHLSFASGFGFQVQRVHTDWAGAYLRAEAATLLDKTSAAPVASPFAESFTVEDAPGFVSLALSGAASRRAHTLVVLDPAGQPAETGSANVGEGPLAEEMQLPSTPGEWRVLLPMAHAPDGSFHLLVRQVKLTEVAFP